MKQKWAQIKEWSEGDPQFMFIHAGLGGLGVLLLTIGALAFLNAVMP